jgi:hypothetical protein
MAREQPIKQRRAGAADVEIARRRRGEAGDDSHCSRNVACRSVRPVVCSMAAAVVSIG